MQLLNSTALGWSHFGWPWVWGNAPTYSPPSPNIYTRSGDTILDRANSTIERRAV